MTHTPTPWKEDANHTAIYANCECVAIAYRSMQEGSISEAERKANAALIVRAVNSHEMFVAAAKAARAILEGVAMNCDDNECLKAIENVHDQLTAAIAAAKEGA